MADAKINLETIIEDKGLKSLNTDLAKVEQEAKNAKEQLKYLEKQGKGMSDEAIQLKAQINNLTNAMKTGKQQSNAYAKELTNVGKSADSSKGKLASFMDGLKNSKLGSVTSGFSGISAGALAAGAAVGAAAVAVGAFIKSSIEAGANMQQSIAQWATITGSVQSATEAYRLFNDVGRDTNYDLDSVQKMGQHLMNIGYNAKTAASMIRACSDASAGLGKGQEFTEKLVDTLARIGTTGKVSAKQLAELQAQGLDLNKAFEGTGMTAEEAMKAVQDGSMDGKTAVEALTNYLGSQYNGAMSKAKQNTTDAWGDIQGNIETAMGEIGNAILEGFDKSETLQALAELTNDFVNYVRGPAAEGFRAFGQVAGAVLTEIINLLKWVLDALSDAMDAVVNFAAHKIEMNFDMESDMEGMSDELKAATSEYQNLAAAAERAKSSVGKAQETISAGPTHTIAAPTFASAGGGGSMASSGGGGGRSSSASGTKQKLKQELTELQKFAEQYKAVFQTIPKMKELFGQPEELAQAKEVMLAQLADIKEKGDALLNGGGYSTEDQISGIAKLIGQDPAMLAEELELKKQSIAEFFDSYIAKQEEATNNTGNVEKTETAWTKLANTMRGTVQSSLQDAFYGIITGSKSVGAALGDLVKSVAQSVAQMIAQYMSLVATFMLFGSNPKTASDSALKAMGLVKAATGGYIRGAGTGTSDSIPAMLSNGEYVINAAAVDKFGKGNLDAINAGRMPESIGDGTATIGGSSVSLNVSTMDASSFGDWLQSTGGHVLRQFTTDSARNWTTEAGVW